MKTTSKWHVLYVNYRWEKKVHERIQEAGVESFLPLAKTVRVWSDRKKVLLEPLFKSYVFVNVKSPMDFHKALSVDGACAYVQFGREYAIVRDHEIEQIKLLVGDDEILDLTACTELPAVGEERRIICGALEGLKCEVLKAKNANKILVRIDSLQQNLVATIPSYYLDKKALTA
ncbi:UpxY family transcription antiterminator [Kordia zhangzhouensis]|uniref:UpxY family transcription antiterminator n=1 Tax=Kordia zhangzhouensis TaxID=1620405 RepID=UPI00062902EF|nr:UpxY family transcription antiterminator [Kordia zhangzhouensis]